MRRILVAIAVLALATPARADAPAPDPKAAPAPTGVLTRPPALLHFVEAPYPPEAMSAHLEGQVVLEIDIGVDGRISRAVVVQPAGHGFDEAALAAVKQFQFSPAEIDHKPAPVRVTYRYAFVYKPPPAPPAPPKAKQPGVVNFEGTLLERGTRQPLARAHVRVTRAGEALETEADPSGHFQFEDLAPGRWTVSILDERHERYDTTEDIAPNERTTATYYVRRRSTGYEATVRAHRERKEVARRTLTLEEIQKIPGTQGDAIRVVQNLPGVARTPLGLGPLIVRGGRTGDTRSYIDGQLVPILFHFGGLTSVINSDFLDTLDFYPGDMPVRYGRSIAGAVDVNTRAGKRDRYRSYADVSLYQASLFAEGPLTSRGSFMASVRRSYIDTVLPVILKFVPNGDQFAISPQYWDYQLKTDWDLGKDKLSFFLFGSYDALKFALSSPASFTTESRGNLQSSIGFHRLTARWDRVLGKNLTNSLRATIGTDRTTNAVGADIYVNVDLDTLTVREDLGWKPLDQVALDGGVDFIAAHFAYGVQAPPLPLPGQTFNPNLNGQLEYVSDDGGTLEPALYLDAVLKPVRGLKLVPGLRWDYEGYTRRAWFDPRVAGFWNVLGGLTFKASAGLYHQPPTPEKLTKRFGNPNLIEEGSAQYAAGFEWHFLELWDVDLQGYWKNLFDQATSSLAVTTTAGEAAFANAAYENSGSGYAYGAELLLRREPGHGLFGWLAVSVGEVYRRAAPGEPFVQSPLNQRYNVVGVVSYKLPHDVEIGARARLVDGDPFTVYAGHVYDVDSDNEIPLPPSTTETARQPPFFQLDVRVDEKFVFDRWILDAYLDLMNATNYANVEAENWNYDFTKYQPVYGLPIFPAIGLRGEY